MTTDYLQQQDPNDLRNIVLGLERRLAALERSYVDINQLSELASDAGELRNALIHTQGDTMYIQNYWANLGGKTVDTNGIILAMVKDEANNCLYLGGNFTMINGVEANRVAKYDLATKEISALGSGLSSGYVSALALMSDGTLLLGGTFLNAGGDGNADTFCQWTGSAFSAVGTAFGGNTQPVYAIAVDAQDNIYVGGNFVNIGNANGDYIVKCTIGGVYTSLGSGLSATVYALAVLSDDTLLVGGSFVNAGGDADADNFCQWTGSAFSAVGTAFGGSASFVYAIAVDSQDNIYVGGAFTNRGDANGDYIVKCTIDGTYESLGGGAGALVRAIAIDNSDRVYVGLYSTGAGTIGGVQMWDGVVWARLQGGFNGDSVVYALVYTDDYLFAGGRFSSIYGGGFSLRNFARWGAATLEEFLGMLANKGMDNLMASYPAAAVPASTTRYSGPGNHAYAASTAEAYVSFWPRRAGTVKRLWVVTATAQGASGALTLTLRLSGVDTNMVCTINASDAAGTQSESVNEVGFAATDYLSYKVVNGANLHNSAILVIFAEIEYSD